MHFVSEFYSYDMKLNFGTFVPNLTKPNGELELNNYNRRICYTSEFNLFECTILELRRKCLDFI